MSNEDEYLKKATVHDEKRGAQHVLVSMNSRHKRTKITIGETMKV